MKKIILYAVTASIICSIYACNKDDAGKEDKPFEFIELTAKQAEKVSADNRFSFKMFKEVSEENTFFSPFSLNMALGMLYNGTSGDTRTEMAEALGMAGLTEAEINEYYQKISQALLKIDPLTDMSIANSIWYRSGFPVKKPFIDLNKNYFDAEVRDLDFNRNDAADIINKWCAEKTKDRIKGIIASPIPDEIVMYLINALYFKSQWQFQFDKAYTKQEDFATAGNPTTVNMMTQTSNLPYYSDQYLQCVEIPYGNQAFSMVAILPAHDSSIDQLIEYLDYTVWENIVKNMHEQNVWLKLPRFKIECDIPLNDPVINAGMQLIFDKDLADLSNISDVHLFVSNIKQKTFVEVNEEGTEAAAVTVIGFGSTSSGGGNMSIPFFANRPFLYLIKEKSTGAILFIGRMDEPKE